MSNSEAVIRALKMLLNTPSWQETHAVLKREQTLLLSDTADHLLAANISEARRQGDQERVDLLELHYELLNRVRAIGLSAAWKEFEATTLQTTDSRSQDGHDTFTQTCLAWINMRDRREGRRFLEAHPELLVPRAETLLNTLMSQYSSEPETQEYLSGQLRLIQDIRTRGATRTAIQQGYVDAFNGFVLDLPSWLEAVTDQLKALYQKGPLAQTATARRHLLQQTVRRAEQERKIAPEVRGTLYYELGLALQQESHTERFQALEAALAALQAVLQVYTLSDFPQQYAASQNNMGIVYAQRQAGKRRENLELALTCYQEALRVYTLVDFPEDYAMTQYNLGNAYRARLAGNQHDNLERAIACYQEALHVRTLADFPQEYGQTQHNLGNAYQERLVGTRSDNLELAIACWQQALRVRTLKDFPVQYAMTQHNLGNAYHLRVIGDRQQNQEQAIACCQEALRVRTLTGFPEEYAQTQNTLATIYQDRLAGKRRENLELAITCYQEALRIYTLAHFPTEYAGVRDNLGDAYQKRLAGNRRDNLEQALDCYQEALRVRTLVDFPKDYASTQHSLGSAYLRRQAGKRRENVERAIACFQQALHIFTLVHFPKDYAQVHNDQGIAYATRLEGKRRDNLERAIACYQEALHVYTLIDFPEEYAATRSNLGAAYRDRLAGNRRDNLEQAITCHQEALRVRTLADFPEGYAISQHCLGVAYSERQVGNRQENLEHARTCFQEALRVRTLADFPEDYAMTQNTLGAAYTERLVGDRRDNLEQAFVHYQEALRVYTLSDFPEQYASVQNNMGNAYRNRLMNHRRENQERAIACYQQALCVRTLADFPEDYAITQINLGGTYADRIASSRRENLEQALTCYQEALRVYTLKDDPERYATTQKTQGDIYRQRMTGERHENLERAIACYQQAMRVYTLADFPEDYASTQNVLGTAYLERLADSQQENQERAIAFFQEALRIYTLADFPTQYASLQNNLGTAYHDRLTGSPRENWEQTFVHYREALRVYTLADFPEDYATTQNNLGASYQNRLAGNRRENLEQALICYQETLRFYTLADFPYEYVRTQLNVAFLAYDALSTEAAARGDSEGVQAAYELAHSAFAAARHIQDELGWLESDEQGRSSLQGQNYATRELSACDAWCLWRLGRIEEAVVALEAGRAQSLTEAQTILDASLEGICAPHRASFSQAREEVADARRHQGFAEARHRQELSETQSIQEPISLRAARDAFLHARQAIRNHCQPHFLSLEPTWQEISAAPDAQQTLVYLTATYQGGLAFIVPPVQRPDAAVRIPLAIPLPGLTKKVVDTWLIQRDQEGQGVGGFRLALDLRASGLLMYWASQGEEETEKVRRLALPVSIVADALPESMRTLRQALHRLVEHWQAEAQRLSGRTPQQQQAAQTLLAQVHCSLGQALITGTLREELDWFLREAELERLLPELSKNILHPLRHELNALGLQDSTLPIALIPCGRLGALPLHAALVPAPRSGEDVPFQETCELTYQASARMLATSRAAVDGLPQTGMVMTVGDPQPTQAPRLPWAEAEAEVIAHLARQAHRAGSQAILGESATLPRMRRELASIGTSHPGAWVHIASHGHANPVHPTDCFMLLASDERLTLADLQRERFLKGVRGFAASGCVTGRGDLETAPDELSSFAAGILQAGAACALATLWSVSDRATFLLMLRFYQVLLGDPSRSPAWALREAGRWLRHATRQDLDQLAQARLKGLRPLSRDNNRQSRDAVRGIITQTAPPAIPHEDLPEGQRFPATQALERFRSVGSVKESSERPYAHPIYWACAVVYGA